MKVIENRLKSNNSQKDQKVYIKLDKYYQDINLITSLKFSQ